MTVCNLFGRGDHDTLTLLNDLHKLRRLNKRVHRAGVQPRIAAAEQLHVERAVLEVHAVKIGDFQLAACRRLDLLCQIYDTLVVEIQTGNRVVGFWLFGLFLDRNDMPIIIKLHDTETLRIVDVITEHGCLTILCCLNSLFQMVAQTGTVEDVVAEHHCARLITDELLTERKCLRQTIWRWLHLVRQIDTVAAAISEQTLEIRQISRCRDDQNIANSGQHQRGKRIINHRLVVNRQQLLARYHGQRIQSRTATAC